MRKSLARQLTPSADEKGWHAAQSPEVRVLARGALLALSARGRADRLRRRDRRYGYPGARTRGARRIPGDERRHDADRSRDVPTPAPPPPRPYPRPGGFPVSPGPRRPPP